MLYIMKIIRKPSFKNYKFHRGIKFEISVWLEEYINLNTKLMIVDKQSETILKVNFFKVMNNSVFGKTLANIRNLVDIRLISSHKLAQEVEAKPSYVRCTIFDENLIAIQMKETKLYFNKPFILELAFLAWVNPWCMTFITTILRLNMGK